MQYNRKTIIVEKVPNSDQSKFYDENDNVLFGSEMVKGTVCYKYIAAKLSIDNKPIYLGATVNYDGVGNQGIEEKDLIKPFKFIKAFLEN